MAQRGGRYLDEDDVRVRPSRGKSRPRSKDRPTHGDAVPAMVTAVDDNTAHGAHAASSYASSTYPSRLKVRR